MRIYLTDMLLSKVCFIFFLYRHGDVNTMSYNWYRLVHAHVLLLVMIVC